MSQTPDQPVAPASFPCPKCGKPSFWTNNPNRPFCSERCKLIDLGAWASEDYRIPEQTQASQPSASDEHDD